MIVTRTGALARVLAAHSPPNPAPMITTCGSDGMFLAPVAKVDRPRDAVEGRPPCIVEQHPQAIDTRVASTRRRNATMEIRRSGSQPSAKGSAEYFTGAVRVD